MCRSLVMMILFSQVEVVMERRHVFTEQCLTSVYYDTIMPVARSLCALHLITPTRITVSSPGVPNLGGTWSCWSKARGGHKADKRTGITPLKRQAEKIGALQPGEEKVVWRPHDNLPVSEGAYREAGEGHFVSNCRDGRSNNGNKVKEGKFRLDIRTNFFTVRMLGYQISLPRENVESPALEVFKTMPHLESVSSSGLIRHNRDMELLKQVQWRVTRMTKGLEHICIMRTGCGIGRNTESGPHQCLSVSAERGQRRALLCSALLDGAEQQDKRQWGNERCTGSST
ncbi:hypothetical protein DUI87_06620 [Hirundo rustica rustica]|uniref:Uncharacterized protein n=1 Tax=Hirundo rustica rustica TaxID=333673 RepID=A0A3M0KVF6_HIRRU|nr:hypothetical protein DUI87_06620 [Hirundo rustica rustica]